MNTRGEQTRQRILDAARPLFAKKGYKAVTMKDICEATGLSRGGLYGHFDSTEQIFLEIIHQLPQERQSWVNEQMRRQVPAVKILDAFLEEYQQSLLDETRSLILPLLEYFSDPAHRISDRTMVDNHEKGRHMWTDLIRYGIDRGEFNDLDAQALFTLAITSSLGLKVTSQFADVDPGIPAQISRFIRQLLVREN